MVMYIIWGCSSAGRAPPPNIVAIVQGIEQQPSKLWVAGSIPAGDAKNTINIWAGSLMVKRSTHNRLSESSILSQPTKDIKCKLTIM